ncbi:MAG: hypothetical protein Q9162_002799 [Coniocarpon cinnabarinum]
MPPKEKARAFHTLKELLEHRDWAFNPPKASQSDDAGSAANVEESTTPISSAASKTEPVSPKYSQATLEEMRNLAVEPKDDPGAKIDEFMKEAKVNREDEPESHATTSRTPSDSDSNGESTHEDAASVCSIPSNVRSREWSPVPARRPETPGERADRALRRMALTIELALVNQRWADPRDAARGSLQIHQRVLEMLNEVYQDPASRP